MDLNLNLIAAVARAVTDVMNAYGRKLAGRNLPSLDWSLVPSSGNLTGYTSDYAEGEVPEVLAGWAQVLGLTPAPDDPSLAGSVEYVGTVEGRTVRIWGVVDRGTWERETGERA